MNKGKVRDNQFAARKHELIAKILDLMGQTHNSEVAQSLRRKTGKRLAEIYESKKGI